MLLHTCHCSCLATPLFILLFTWQKNHMHEYHNFTENHHVAEIEFCGLTSVLFVSLSDTGWHSHTVYVCHCVSVFTVWHAHSYCALSEAHLGPAHFLFELWIFNIHNQHDALFMMTRTTFNCKSEKFFYCNSSKTGWKYCCALNQQHDMWLLQPWKRALIE